MKIYKKINNRFLALILILILIFIFILLITLFILRNYKNYIIIQENYDNVNNDNNNDTIIPPLTQNVQTNIQKIIQDEVLQKEQDAVMNLKIQVSKGVYRDLMNNIKTAEDIKFYNDESKKIQDLIKNTKNNKEKYSYIQFLLDFYYNKDNGWYNRFKEQSNSIEVIVNSLYKLGSNKFDKMADNLLIQKANFDIIIDTIETNTTDLKIQSKKLEEIFKKEAAEKRSRYLEKLNEEVKDAQCTTHSYKEFCEQSTDSCTWLGDSCKRFEKNPFPQPSNKITLV